jgi:hypothetical protein
VPISFLHLQKIIGLFTFRPQTLLMKYFYLLFLAVIICPFVSSAQKNFKPSFIVTLKGDTINGFIDYREWDSNPRSIKFKTEISGPEKILTSSDISYFNVNNKEQFKRYAGRITRDRIDEAYVLNERDTTFIIDTVFLKVILKGKYLTVYSYIDDVKTRFYYTEKDNEMPNELGYRLYYNNQRVNTITNTGRTVNENTYMKQLYALAQKYNVLDTNLQRTIEDSNYKKYHIVRIANLINGAKQ